MEKLWRKNALEMYLPMTTNITDIRKTPLQSLGCLFMGQIHEETRDNVTKAHANNFNALLNKHHNPGTRHAMDAAQKNIVKSINGKQYVDMSYFEEYQVVSQTNDKTSEALLGLVANFIVEQKKEEKILLAKNKPNLMEIPIPTLNIKAPVPPIPSLPKQLNIASALAKKKYQSRR